MTLDLLPPPPLPAPTAPPQEVRRTTHGSIWHYAEECLTQTAAAVHNTRAASASEVSHAIAAAREAHAMGIPADLLAEIVKLQGHADEHFSNAILALGNKVAGTLSNYQPLIPFAGKLLAPSAFYDSFDQIHRIARAILSPVIYAEDTDVIGTASINPVASAILAAEIDNTVFKRIGIHPFVTATRLDYESWTFLSRKHFEV